MDCQAGKRKRQSRVDGLAKPSIAFSPKREAIYTSAFASLFLKKDRTINVIQVMMGIPMTNV
ncbi:hypothetical protein GCM10020370_37780 [Paenibacillus hodogayensis]